MVSTAYRFDPSVPLPKWEGMKRSDHSALTVVAEFVPRRVQKSKAEGTDGADITATGGAMPTAGPGTSTGTPSPPTRPGRHYRRPTDG